MGGGHGRSGEGVLASGERGGRGLNERRRVAEGVETPLLGQQLLVRHRVDVRREAERGAEEEAKGRLFHGKCGGFLNSCLWSRVH